MTTQIEIPGKKRLVLYAVIFVAVALMFAAIATPNLLRSRIAADEAARVGRERSAMAEFFGSSLPKRQMASPVGGVLRRISETTDSQTPAGADRKIIRKVALQLTVDSPRAALDRMMQIVELHGGYVVSAELSGSQERQTGTMVLRVPVAEFDSVREQAKKLAKSVESEQISSEDVTMQYVENEATLRNFRAEEASYLEIMKRSGKISDTLEVARQLADVRGRIERLQAQVRAMDRDTAMTAIAINLSAEPVATVKNQWRPWYAIKTAWNDGMDSLATFAVAIMAIAMQLPAILAWSLTVVFGGKLLLVLLKRLAIYFGFWKYIESAPQQ